MPSQEDINEIVRFLFTLQQLNKLYHWNTTSFARHKATDNFAGKLLEITDKFVEVFMGRYNLKPMVTSLNLKSEYLSDLGIVSLFEVTRRYLENMSNKITDSDLLNIRDELLSEVNVILYLFRLN
jgi:hypothetical protein